MKLGDYQILVFLLGPVVIGCENKFWETPFGALDGIIKQILESSRPYLTNLFLNNTDFETGPQEFGNFKGNLTEVTVRGLENFRVKILDTTLLDVRNLTIVVESFTAKGFYGINGTLAFPLGKNDIHLFGDGQFSAKLENSSVSVKLIIRFEGGVKKVRDFDIVLGLEKMHVYLENLMGGGELEKTFNKLINEVGLTVFYYYEAPVLNAIKPIIIEKINEMLSSGHIFGEPQFLPNIAKRILAPSRTGQTALFSGFGQPVPKAAKGVLANVGRALMSFLNQNLQ